MARQVMLGVVQTAEGLPLHHEVFDGNTAAVQTLKPTLQKIVARYPVKRVIAVADRGLLSVDNLEELETIILPGGGRLEFILAVPGRRYGEFVELLGPLQCSGFAQAQHEVLAESRWNDLRLIVAHDPKAAAHATTQRDTLIATLEQQAAQWVSKLDAQDAGKPGRGRKLSDGGARLPERIRAHATICFIALILHRGMRSRLRATSPTCSPERALAKLRRIQHHRVSINAAQPVAGLSSIDHEQAAILAALELKKPTLNTQLTLLWWSV